MDNMKKPKALYLHRPPTIVKEQQSVGSGRVLIWNSVGR
jgi:hypothetical protein